MRFPAVLSAGSLLSVLLPLAACNLYGEREDCSSGYSRDDYGSCKSYYSYPYNPNGYDSGTSTRDCSMATSFSIGFSIDAESGDCKLVLGRDDGAAQTATYYLPEPADDAGTACVVLDGPAIEQCTRVGRAVAVGSVTASEAAALRSQLGLHSWESSFRATLFCSGVLAPQRRNVDFNCAASVPASPTTGSPDAGTPESSPGDEDAGTTPDADVDADVP